MSLVKGPGWSAAHPRNCLPLLPSGPDGVHKLGLRWAWPRILIRRSPRRRRPAGAPRPGLGFAGCPSGCPRVVRIRGSLLMSGGDERIRTADPLVANEVLSQLSYIPTRTWGWSRAASQPATRATGRRHSSRGRGGVKHPGAPRDGSRTAVRSAGNGGERGIRTLEAVLAPTRFPIVLLQPLGHLSATT